jgi:hypothetical protein
VNVLAPGDRSSESREALHKDTLWQEFDGEPTFEDTTNWVIGRIDRDIVDGFDRTAVLERSPILSCSPLPDDAPANPFREFVIVVQSTPWGTLEIGAHLVPVRSKGHAIELVESLTDECLDRILESPDPIADGPGYSEIGAAGATGPVPTTVEWSAMTDVERDRILLAALEHFDDGSGVGLEKLLELLEQRYRTPRAEAREYIDALVDRDEVVEPPEVRVALAPSGCDNNTM